MRERFIFPVNFKFRVEKKPGNHIVQYLRLTGKDGMENMSDLITQETITSDNFLLSRYIRRKKSEF